MSKILYPIEYYDIQENEIPLFLIWPIRGTYDWQDEVAQKISNLISPDSHVVFINPRRQDEKKFLTPGFETRFSRQNKLYWQNIAWTFRHT